MDSRRQANPLTLALLLALIPGLPAVAGPQGQPEDCNKNGVPDADDINNGTSADCNVNGIPDECDVGPGGGSEDCNQDGIPDECLKVCPPIDVVYVFDTSGSMADDSQILCANLNQIDAAVMAQGVTINTTILGIIPFVNEDPNDFPCITMNVETLLGGSVPGTTGPGEENLDDNEDWGPATAIVADRFQWTPGSLRLIIPVSDEAPEDGGSETCDAEDTIAINNAIAFANANGVIVSPIAASGAPQCAIDLGAQMAQATGGQNFVSRAAEDLVGAVVASILSACDTVADCNKNGVPDGCDVEGGFSEDCNENGIPDECENNPCPDNDLNCTEFDRFEDLTANDTLTLLTDNHNPQQEQGYAYVFAVTSQGAPVAADQLIGQLLVISGIEVFQYSVNAVDYRAGVADGLATDVDSDGIRDLDGKEYEQTAGEILVPRFLGFDAGRGTLGELILIGLSGGSQFDTTADLLIYNDDEDQFSAQHTFFCWDKVPVSEISDVFKNEWLANYSGDDEYESLGNLEYGWFRVNGRVASSTFYSLLDPAIYAVYIERIGNMAAADLPFETCLQSGHLLPRSVSGDNSETADEPSDETCESALGRREPASLLLFPEFDNRQGSITVFTVTNVSATDDVRVHFIYVGRFGA